MQRKTVCPLVGIIVPIGFFGCGDGNKPERRTAPKEKSGAVDACSMVTQADAEAHFGSGPVEPGREIGPGLPGQIGRCEWQLPGKRGPAVPILVVEIYRDASYYTGDHKRSRPGVSFVELGERGYLESANDSTLQAQFVADGRTILITYTFAAETGIKAAARTDQLLHLAREVAAGSR